MNPLTKSYRKVLLIFVGNGERFSLEHRVFNLISVFICFAGLVSLILNLSLGLYESAIISIIIFIIQSAIFYFSRVEKKFRLAVLLTGIELHTLLSINYFINGGINGPTVILFLATLYILATVANRKNSWFWLALNFCLLATLFGVEYFYPQSIIMGYTDKFVFFSDMYITYAIVIVLVTVGIFYNRRAYENQKNNLETKAISLEKLNAEKNKLFSIISHDLRAPLGSVKQYLSLINDQELSHEEKTTIQTGLIKSTNEAYELLDNLLTWAKSQLDGSKPFITSLKPAETLANTLSQATTYAKDKEITLTQRIDDVNVFADENMLQIVIRNLIYNAIKFSKPGGQIDFKVYAENGTAIFVVHDEGMGISEADHKKIFSLDIKPNVGTKKEKGAGLGLVLCKDYIRLQDGKIWFKSESDKGSTFFVSLPLYKGQKQTEKDKYPSTC